MNGRVGQKLTKDAGCKCVILGRGSVVAERVIDCAIANIGSRVGSTQLWVGSAACGNHHRVCSSHEMVGVGCVF